MVEQPRNKKDDISGFAPITETKAPPPAYPPYSVGFWLENYVGGIFVNAIITFLVILFGMGVWGMAGRPVPTVLNYISTAVTLSNFWFLFLYNRSAYRAMRDRIEHYTQTGELSDGAHKIGFVIYVLLLIGQLLVAAAITAFFALMSFESQGISMWA